MIQQLKQYLYTSAKSQQSERQALHFPGWALVALVFISPVSSADTDDEASITTIIKAIELGWEQADGTPFRQHYLDFEGARYIEGGGQNTGLTDLIEHHVEPEGDALSDFDLTLSNIEIQVEGDFAWAIADIELEATVRKDNQSIYLRGYETFIFRSIDGEWKVVHTHSSSRPVKSDEGDHEH